MVGSSIFVTYYKNEHGLFVGGWVECLFVSKNIDTVLIKTSTYYVSDAQNTYSSTEAYHCNHVGLAAQCKYEGIGLFFMITLYQLAKHKKRAESFP